MAAIVGIAVGATLVLNPFLPCVERGQAPTPIAFYDLQIAEKFANVSNELDYVVAATEQEQSCGYGVAYLLNAETASGWWIQVGLSWDWSSYQGARGFLLNYEAFNSGGLSVWPSGGGSGLVPFAGVVGSGDQIELDLNDAGGSVTLSGRDLITGARAAEVLTLPNASSVVPGLNQVSSDGFFTGLMTECYRSGPGSFDLSNDTYIDRGPPVRDGESSVDEWDDSRCVTPSTLVALGPVFSGFNDNYTASLEPWSAAGVTTWTSWTQFTVS